MLVITCLIVCPETIGSVAGSQELSQEHMYLASEIVVTQRFAELFRNMCHMDSIPDINLQQIKFVKSDSDPWERSPLKKLVKIRQLVAYKFTDFWHCMDTLRDKQYLNNLIKTKRAVWKIW